MLLVYGAHRPKTHRRKKNIKIKNKNKWTTQFTILRSNKIKASKHFYSYFRVVPFLLLRNSMALSVIRLSIFCSYFSCANDCVWSTSAIAPSPSTSTTWHYSVLCVCVSVCVRWYACMHLNPFSRLQSSKIIMEKQARENISREQETHRRNGQREATWANDWVKITNRVHVEDFQYSLRR